MEKSWTECGLVERFEQLLNKPLTITEICEILEKKLEMMMNEHYLDMHERRVYEEEKLWDYMKEQQQEAKQTLCKIVHHDYVEDFAMILAAAWNSRCHEAEQFAKGHGLKDSDFFAILEDVKEYEYALSQEGHDYE